MAAIHASTAKPEEISRFSDLAATWWDENGPMKPLHRLNPVRLDYIGRIIRKHFGVKDLSGLNILDVGCAAGLVSENMARLGASMTGIDASESLIAAAKTHAAAGKVKVEYRHAELQTLIAEKKTFDVVLALEVIEHVSDAAAFAQQCAGVCRDGGLVIFSTLNRTAKSLALGIIGAEYIMRWLPIGTHDWKSFLKPSELDGLALKAGLTTTDICGLSYNPLTDRFAINQSDVAVNYFLAAKK